MIRFAPFALVALTLGGCALTSKSTPLNPRYFTLDYASEGQGRVQGDSTATAARGKLRLGAIEAASHLRERMVFRDSPVELSFHEEQRWSERPQSYLRRGLMQALFDERGVNQSLVGDSVVLDAELLALDELRGKQAKVHVSVHYALHDDSAVLREGTASAERPLQNDDPEARVVAFREALREVIEKVADQSAEVAKDQAAKLEAEAAAAIPAPPPPPAEPVRARRGR